jgi:hypothetical protein
MLEFKWLYFLLCWYLIWLWCTSDSCTSSMSILIS